MSVYKKISSFSFWFFRFLVFRPSNGFVISMQLPSRFLNARKLCSGSPRFSIVECKCCCVNNISQIVWYFQVILMIIIMIIFNLHFCGWLKDNVGLEDPTYRLHFMIGSIFNTINWETFEGKIIWITLCKSCQVLKFSNPNYSFYIDLFPRLKVLNVVNTIMSN